MERKKQDRAALIADRLLEHWQKRIGLAMPVAEFWIWVELRDGIAETLDLVACCSCNDFHCEDE